MDVPNSDGVEELVNQLAGRIQELGLAGPGIAFLEANKPFSFLGSQFLLFMQPLLDPFVGSSVTGRYIGLLQDRSNIERLIQKLEADGS